MIRMVESFTFRGHLCIVTELLSINLYELVKANSFAGFSTTLIRRFASQILKSLILLYHHRVVHCDLKPEVRFRSSLPSVCTVADSFRTQNILLRHPAKSGIKVIDFGSSCFENEKGSFSSFPLTALPLFDPSSCSVYTYIQSRFYRSPEVILGMNYHMGIDVRPLPLSLSSLPLLMLLPPKDVESRLHPRRDVHRLPHLPW